MQLVNVRTTQKAYPQFVPRTYHAIRGTSAWEKGVAGGCDVGHLGSQLNKCHSQLDQPLAHRFRFCFWDTRGCVLASHVSSSMWTQPNSVSIYTLIHKFPNDVRDTQIHSIHHINFQRDATHTNAFYLIQRRADARTLILKCPSFK